MKHCPVRTSQRSRRSSTPLSISRATARAALLDERCASRAAIRAEVDSLFAVHGPCRTRAWEPSCQSRTERRAGAARRQASGAWRLLRKIGSGGMGDVYLAERGDGAFEGYAAVKLTRALLPDMDAARRSGPNASSGLTPTPQHRHAARRWSRRRAGVPGDGTRRRDTDQHALPDHGLPLEESLQLMRRVAARCSIAHQRGIVHRDLKPSNILVTATAPRSARLRRRQARRGPRSRRQLTAAYPGRSHRTTPARNNCVDCRSRPRVTSMPLAC